jgi:hypothetical protein
MSQSTQTGRHPADQKSLSSDETYSLISADKVRGTSIYSLAGEKAGKVEDLMIDKISGRVAYAVVLFGGFLGMGGERRALPWAVLSYDTNRDGYVVSASDAVLEGTPPLGDLGDRDWGTRLHTYYGVSPFWL